MSQSNYFERLWENIKRSDTFLPTYIEFPDDKTDDTGRLPKVFDDRQHYFMVSVNEMFLSYDRLWYQEFSPMVISVCNFKYDGETLEIPYIIGPSHLEKYKPGLPNPKGMLFLNTPVVGVHPWRGGNVSISLILCRVKQKNNAEKILKIVEDVSNSLDFSTGLANYTKIGRVVLNGFDALLGFEQTSPLLGINNNFGQASGNPFRPGFYALIHAENLDKNKFWVINNGLHYGNSKDTAEPYRDNDYVLFKIGITDTRDDEESLAYYKEYKSIYEYIKNQTELNENQLSNLKSRLRNLAVTITLSPDLASGHAERIWIKKKEEIESFVDKLTKLDGAKELTESNDSIDKIMNKALDDLNF